MPKIQFDTDDSYGLEINYPYIVVKFSKEEAEKLNKRIPDFYIVDGHLMIDVKDKGKSTGEKMMFIYFS